MTPPCPPLYLSVPNIVEDNNREVVKAVVTSTARIPELPPLNCKNAADCLSNSNKSCTVFNETNVGGSNNPPEIPLKTPEEDRSVFWR